MENQTVFEVGGGAVLSGNHEDAAYDAYLGRVRERFDMMTQGGNRPLFQTDAAGLWEAYLSAFPDHERQFHNCNACRRFIQDFGGLVVLSEGVAGSAIWHESDAPEMYKPSVAAMLRLVRGAQVTGVFLSSLPVWGHPQTGVWRHVSIVPARFQMFKHAINTAHQAMAAKREDFNTVRRALAEFKPSTIEQALTLLKSDSLYRSEKVLGQAQWLADLNLARTNARRDLRDNVLWERIAAAPDGFCHPRASMIGSLLEDIEGGLAFNEVSRRFAMKMNPLHYQRPQAAPTVGNIAQAEKLVEKLGIARSLERRFARLDEIRAIWKPREQERSGTSGGVFSHLKPKGAAASDTKLDVPVQTMTWEKFERTVLSDAVSIEFDVPHIGNFGAIVTATHADAAPIHQWDRLDQRNPASSYVYHNGSAASQWRLRAVWTPVTAICGRPAHWFGSDMSHHSPGVFFLFADAKDSGYEHSGLGLFPETLKSELREVRSTIEAYSKNGVLGGYEEASACGYLLQSEAGVVRLRVTLASGVRAEYKIDRWD